MDVRCEKCQTEYELDEARLKPGGVTVKCTNCGHMFKIRKRTPTSVGAAPPTERLPERPRVASKQPPVAAAPRRADSIFEDVRIPDDGQTPGRAVEGDRQWLIRLANGEQKSCRELAMLQQWIVAGVVTRESLISRTGKTWKRLGDIAELAQYFTIADEARNSREIRAAKPTGRAPNKDVASTMLGYGRPAAAGAAAAGGTILPDDDDEVVGTTGNFRAIPSRAPATTPPPVPRSAKTPPMGSSATTPPSGVAATQPAVPLQPRRPLTTPPPPPAKRTQSQSGPMPLGGPTGGAIGAIPGVPGVGTGNRSTAGWATESIAGLGL